MMLSFLFFAEVGLLECFHFMGRFCLEELSIVARLIAISTLGFDLHTGYDGTPFQHPGV
jgi:hypothetical protein